MFQTMALCNSSNSCLQSPKPFFALIQISIFLLLLLIPSVNPLYFKFPNFEGNPGNVSLLGNATFSEQLIELTVNKRDRGSTKSLGQAIYKHQVHLWDLATKRLTDFTTRFSFNISTLNEEKPGDGIAFFITPNDSIPPSSGGGYLGLVSHDHRFNSTENPFVAVEFDTYWNVAWDPKNINESDHIGININSILSNKSLPWPNISNSKIGNAWVSYNSSTHNLSVFLTYDDNPVFSGNSSLSYTVDLSRYLPERVFVGLSASTGNLAELHKILSWEFNSSLEIGNSSKKINIKLVVGLVVGGATLIGGLGLVRFVLRKKRNRGEEDVDEVVFDMSMDDELEKGTGPKRFLYGELARSTNNFAEERKLGEGGFGGVYRGFLSEFNLDVAVKRVSKGSKQGIKEYMSEVKIISRLRHRNLVQLVGWCHQRRELLLVYELMPNGSLDSHLFKEKSLLPWEVRYKIAQGLASVLLYLHQDGEQCVVHRDIKSSNVMLDSNFNAKLGDFGLARLVDHGQESKTTMLAGTRGYMAPEYVTTGKARKESDVYSFGVVSLEIACGRRPVDLKAEPNKIMLVEWVWELYGEGKLLEAADERLVMDFDEKEMKCLMVVGLWCAHPDHTCRPSIRQAINVLNFEAPVPNLPAKLPVPMYYAPPTHMCKFSYALFSGLTHTERDQSQCSCSSCTTDSLKLTVPSSGCSPTHVPFAFTQN